MVWTEPKPPTKDISRYDHVISETPLGTLKIEWKSWKENDSFDISLDEGYIGYADSLEEAKTEAYKYLEDKCVELGRFLGIFLEEPVFHHDDENIKHLNAMLC